MKNIRIFRLFLAIIFFVAAVVWLCLGPQFHPMAEISVKSQIILSTISVSLGATIFWLIISFLLGRIYCATVCPVGSLTDFFARLGGKLPFLRRRPYRYKKPSRTADILLIIYILALLLGFSIVPVLIEPWNIMRNMAGVIRPEASRDSWILLGTGAGFGLIAGIISFVTLAVWAILRGREFCTSFCPLGGALGAISSTAIMHIEIDPDFCIDCGRCEDVCSASCINIPQRNVDNNRCLRCFDCLAVCPNNAIRYQSRRNTPMTPLLRRSAAPKSG